MRHSCAATESEGMHIMTACFPSDLMTVKPSLHYAHLSGH